MKSGEGVRHGGDTAHRLFESVKPCYKGVVMNLARNGSNSTAAELSKLRSGWECTQRK